MGGRGRRGGEINQNLIGKSTDKLKSDAKISNFTAEDLSFFCKFAKLPERKLERFLSRKVRTFTDKKKGKHSSGEEEEENTHMKQRHQPLVKTFEIYVKHGGKIDNVNTFKQVCFHLRIKPRRFVKIGILPIPKHLRKNHHHPFSGFGGERRRPAFEHHVVIDTGNPLYHHQTPPHNHNIGNQHGFHHNSGGIGPNHQHHGYSNFHMMNNESSQCPSDLYHTHPPQQQRGMNHGHHGMNHGHHGMNHGHHGMNHGHHGMNHGHRQGMH